MGALPTWFEMGAIRWEITWDQDLLHEYEVLSGENLFGYTDRLKTIVVVDPRLSLPRRQETLLHEIMHASTDYITSSSDKPTEEEIVTHSAPLLLQAIRSNPDLRKFLFNAGPTKSK